VISCSYVVGYQHFEGPSCLHPISGQQQTTVKSHDKILESWHSKTLVSYHISTLCHNPEGHNLNSHHHENLKSGLFHFIMAPDKSVPGPS
jgi:hypothetical protein